MSQLQPAPSKRKVSLAILVWGMIPLSGVAVMAAQHYDGWSPYRDGIWYDPIELNPFIQSDLHAADQEAWNLTKEQEVGEGKFICSRGMQRHYWLTKQAILRDKYGIKWRTPAEMNPGEFD
jgi:hypothetical protein